MNRLEFLKSVIAALMVVNVLPNVIFSETSSPKIRTRQLALSFSPEFATDLNAFHGIDPIKELQGVLLLELDRELGNARGTLKMTKTWDENFEPRIVFHFREDGQFGQDTVWGLGKDALISNT